ncbi:MAG: hypothetical protein K2W82_17485 [Candidatus Obscuribacterales bacterium]|nr:hypothetical protein [Candidatus Obscuribacterales bacterium]
MRKDMAEVLSGRPRYYRRSALNKMLRRRKDEEISDEAPKRQRMKHGWIYCRERNENLSPLKRFLYSRVGRKWSDVQGEIRQVLKPGNPAHRLWLEHLRWYVMENAFWVNGEPHDEKGRKLPNVYMPPLFVVHPETGILSALR